MAKFNNLENLILSHNQIKNIDVFSKVPFSNLGRLDLSNNIIDNINVFNKVPFIHLRDLYLSNNNIKFGILTKSPFDLFEDISIFIDTKQNLIIKANNEFKLNYSKIKIYIRY